MAKSAAERLMLELEQCMNASREGFDVEPVSNDLFNWTVRLHSFDSSALMEGLLLWSDATGLDPAVVLSVRFPPDFPDAPPFVRVVQPRFVQYTAHIVNGSVCVEDLSKTGWRRDNSVVQVLIMVRNLLVEGGALVSMDNLLPYDEAEAMQSYARVMAAHGWAAPEPESVADEQP
jgi:ubiquitin-conjugating enzyme E2 Q